MQLINNLKIKLFCELVGIDEFGNSYYQNKKNKRFVVYKGIAEPSKVPANWHGWLHYTTNQIPTKINTHKYSWQKIHLPNLTGTIHAHNPQNFSNKTKKYEAWKPK